MEKKEMTNDELAQLIMEVKNSLESKISKLDNKISKIESNVKARHYDMQNLTYASSNLSMSALVSTAASVGRSPKRLVNSYDTYR